MLAVFPARRLFTALLALLVGLAWLALWLWGASPYSRFLSHHHLEHVRGGGLILVFLAGWLLMIIAMMLPTSMPLVTLFRGVVHRRPDRLRLVALLLAGYLSSWMFFGLLVYTGDAVVHVVVEHSAWSTAHAWLIAPVTLLLAGLYQFTPLKYHCLDKCRSPRAFILERWRGRNEPVQAFRIGVEHGLFCVGCCWPLMLLMFAVGVGSLGWMLALGAIMSIEKNVRWGRRLSTPLGLCLVTWGLFVALAGSSGLGV